MTLTSIAAFIAETNPTPKRSYTVPVRGGSVCVGRYEKTFWRPIKKKDGFRILRTAQIYDRKTRSKGQRSGHLGHIALEILALMVHICDARTGRLEPSLNYIMGKIKRSKQAVVRALANLRRHGFIDWIRRYIPTEQDGPGPQIRQTSNAYKLMLPIEARHTAGHHAKPPPLPGDVITKQERQRAIQDMLDMLSRDDRNEITINDIGDSDFAKALRLLAQNVSNHSG